MLARPGAAGRFALGAFAKAFGVMLGRREPPEGELGSRKRDLLGDVCDGKAQSIIAPGAHRDRNLDRDVERGNDKGEKGGLAGLRFEVIYRRRAEQIFGSLRSWHRP